MNERDMALLRKLGLHVTDLEYKQRDESPRSGPNTSPWVIQGDFTVDESTFRPMCRLIELVDMICESKNPMVEKQFHHLITLLELTK